MKTVLIISAIISLVFGASIPEDAQATITDYKSTNDGKGNYYFSFVTSNGIKRTESGRLVNIGQPDEHIEVQGVVSFTDPDGKLVSVTYAANENGYQEISNPLTDRFPGATPSVIATLLGG